MAVQRAPESTSIYVPPTGPAALSLVEAADYLGLSPSALERAVERGELGRTPVVADAPTFTVDELEDFLGDQRTRAVITGKLTMPLQMSVDVPTLLSTMVAMRDERQAAEALANEIAILAGARCPAVAILRVDDVIQTVRLLALSQFAGRESVALPDTAPNSSHPPIEADIHELPGALRSAINGSQRADARDATELLRPILGHATDDLTTLLRLRGATIYPMLRIGTIRWAILVLLEGDPLEIRPETHDAIEALGIQASIALEAVRLRADVLHRANRAEALYGTVRMLARADDSGKLLENIAVQAARLLTSDAAVVLVVDQALEQFRPGAATGLQAGTHQWSATLSSDFLAGHSAGMTRPLQLTDTSRATAFTMPPLEGGRSTVAAICAPIIHKGTLLGAIEVYSATPRSFSEDDQSLLSAFAHQAAIAIDSIETQENRRRALLGAVEALASANEARDGYTGQHCKRLAQLAVLVSRSLGFSEFEVERIGLGAALHDIGKIAVPDAVLRKPGALTDEERAVINLHPATGEEIVARVPELSDVAQMIGAHQERWDGAGYPRGLSGDDIPLGARIIAVVDTYAALTEDRPYRKGASHADAIRELIRCAGTQLDPAVVDAFVRQQNSISLLMNETDELGTIEWAPTSGTQFRGDATTTSSLVVNGNALQPAHNPQLHRANELAALNDLIRTIASVRELRAMYEQFGTKLAELIEVDALLILVSEGTPAGLRHLPELRRAPFFPPIGTPVEDGISGPVARLKRSLWVNDYREYAIEREIALPANASAIPSSVIAVPLIVDDEFIGMLSVQARNVDAYDKRHVGLLEEIAIHMALALRHHRELTEIEPAEVRRSPTRRLADRLASLGDLELVLDAFITEVSQSVPYEGCLLYLLERGEPRLATADGYYSAAEREAYASFWQTRGQGYIWPAIEGSASFIVPDLAQDDRRIALLRQPATGESALVAPLLHKGHIAGVIFLTRSSEPYTEADEQALAALTTPAAAVITELQQRRQEEDRVRDLAAVSRAVALVSAATSRDSALQVMVEALSDVFGYRLISVYLRDGDEIVLHAQVGYDTIIKRMPLDQGVAARAVREGKPILIEDVSQDSRVLHATPGICSEIAIPFTAGESVSGVLNVESGRERKLGTWDLALIELFSQQASGALANLTLAAPTSLRWSVDPLTGLPDQRAIDRALHAEVERARAAAGQVSVLFFDLDHFKAANDAFGHRFGDELLVWIGGELPRMLPEHAFVGRYGGEEFVVVLPGATIDDADAIASTLRTDLAKRTYGASNGHRVLLSASIGVASISSDLIDAPSLLHAADRAMYVAKRAGRNRIVRWTPELQASLKYM